MGLQWLRGGSGPSVSYIAVLLMAMEEPSYPSLSVPGMGPHGGGGGGGRAGPGCGGGFNVVQCRTVVGGLVHLLLSGNRECVSAGREASAMMDAGRVKYVDNPDFAGHYDRPTDVLEIGGEAFMLTMRVSPQNIHAALGGTIAHEIGHRRNPKAAGRDSRGRGNTPHDALYRFGFECAGFRYIP